MKPNIDIKDKNLEEIANILNTLVADEYVLYTKTRNAHWNVEGPYFMQLHKFFESQYEELDEIIDKVAERVRSAGHYSLGKLKDFLNVTRLSENTNKPGDSKHLIQALLKDHESIICNLRRELVIINDTHGDAATSDFITGIMEQHEKMAWMLRAHLA